MAAPTQTHAHANEFALSGTNGTAPSQVLATPSGDAGGSRSLTHKSWETLGLKPCYRTSLAPTKAPTSDPPPPPPTPTVVEGSNKHRRKLVQQTAGGSREGPFKAFQKGSYKPKRFFSRQLTSHIRLKQRNAGSSLRSNTNMRGIKMCPMVSSAGHITVETVRRDSPGKG